MKPIFTFVFLLFAYSVFAHQVPVHGVVRDNQMRSGLAGVTILVENTNLFAETNENGAFELTVPSGKYTLTALKAGYATRQISLELNEEPADLQIVLSVLAVNLAEVLVRSDKPVSAASSKLLNALDFELRPRNSAQDMLRSAPGLFIAQHAGGGKAEQIFVRGFDADHGTDVAGSIDGMPVNMVSHGHGQGYMDLHFIIPETVQRMEVQKGPYFAENGDFATAAAIKFVTLDELPNNVLQIEAGSTPSTRSYSSGRMLLMYQLPSQNTRLSSYFAAELVQAPQYFEANQRFLRNNIFSKTSYRVSPNASVSLSISGFGSSWNASGQIPERAVSQGLITRFGGIDTTEGGTTQRRNMVLNYKHTDNNGALEMSAFQAQYRFKLYSNFTFNLDNPLQGDGIEQVDNRTVTGLNAKYTCQRMWGAVASKTTFGGGYRADNILNGLYSQQLRQRLAPRAQAQIHEQSVAAFVKNQWQLSDRFSAELALRSDYFIFDVDDQLLEAGAAEAGISGYNFQTLISPKLNLGYDLNTVKLFANAGRGFHSNDARSVVRQQNVHTLPSAWGAELGVQAKMGDVVVSAAFWGLDLENELVYIGDAGETEDKGATRRYGVDLSMRTQLFQSLFVDADLNISESKFLDKSFGEALATDQLVPLAPRLTATGGLIWKEKGGFEAAVRARHLAARAANESGSIQTRGYTVTDLSIRYPFKKISLGLNIENLLNTEWNEAQFATESRLRDEPVAIQEIHFTPGTPFNAKIVFGYKF